MACKLRRIAGKGVGLGAVTTALKNMLEADHWRQNQGISGGPAVECPQTNSCWDLSGTGSLGLESSGVGASMWKSPGYPDTKVRSQGRAGVEGSRQGEPVGDSDRFVGVE